METPLVSWYRDWFNRDEYELVYQERDFREAEKVADLIEREVDLPAGAHLLDVGCGRGRHAISLARRGYRVTGIDLSERALEEARRRASKLRTEVTFEVGDMRQAYCEGCADGVLNLFTAFGYFRTDEEHRQAIRAMATALRPGGTLVQDFMNADLVRRMYVPFDETERDGLRIRQRRWLSDGRINKEIRIESEEREQTFIESVRLLTLDDFLSMYAEAGLELKKTIGSYDGAPYDASSPRLILVAKGR